jgi:hypothetical protein
MSNANAQIQDTTINKHKVDADLLFQKSTKQKTIAWILLPTNIVMAASGSFNHTSVTIRIKSKNEQIIIHL